MLRVGDVVRDPGLLKHALDDGQQAEVVGSDRPCRTLLPLGSA